MDDDKNVGIKNKIASLTGGLVESGFPSHDTRSFVSPVSARHSRRFAAPGRCRVDRLFKVER
jgi:hypothetical protein